MRYAHATPSFWINESNAKLIAAPPKPLPANMKPLASPRLVLKYCDGTVEMTWLVFEVSCRMLCVECITRSMHANMVEVESGLPQNKDYSALHVSTCFRIFYDQLAKKKKKQRREVGRCYFFVFFSHLTPIPINTPEVKNSAPTFLTVKLLRISLPPMQAAPSIAAARTPVFRTTKELEIARAEINAACNDPTKESTAGSAKPSATRAVCITPQAYVVPRDHHSRMKPLATITQPYPPSGAVESASREASRTWSVTVNVLDGWVSLRLELRKLHAGLGAELVASSIAVVVEVIVSYAADKKKTMMIASLRPWNILDTIRNKLSS